MSPGINAATEPEQDAAHVGNLLANTIRDIGIPPCPAVLNRINAEMSKDVPDFNHLDRIICSDVSLAAGLISIANSPFFGLQNRVRSVNEALHMLGLSVSSRAIAGLMLRKLFPLTPSLERFWHSTATIARVGGWLAKNVHNGITVRPDDAYTFSLFRDCGIPILMRRFSQYRDALRVANEANELSFIAVEQTLFPTNHAAVGCLLAQSWWLPDEISLAIRHHHDQQMLEQGSDSKLPVTTLGLIATAQLAEHLFQYHTGLSQGQEWHKLGASCLRLLNLDEKHLADIYEESAPVVTSEV